MAWERIKQGVPKLYDSKFHFLVDVFQFPKSYTFVFLFLLLFLNVIKGLKLTFLQQHQIKLKYYLAN